MLALQLAEVQGRLQDLQARVDGLVRGVERPGWSASQATEELRDVAASVRGLSEEMETLRSRVDSDAERIDEILDVLCGLAGLDFSMRAPVGDEGGRLDALAASCNMLSEELEAAQRAAEAHNRELRAATEAKSRFLAHMSHEIRTPLGALLGFSDLLLDQGLSESERLNCTLVIRRNGEHLLAIINDILDLSKIEAGKLAVERVPFSLGRLLGEIESLMRVRATEKGLSFGVELCTPVPSQIISDPTRVRQVLLNLVGNGVKFTERGSVKVEVRYCEGDPGRLSFDVVDTGIGLSDEAIAQLFQPFEQADASMSRRFGGTGLGLAICKPLAEALDGSISVRSAVGRGSTFRFEMDAHLPAGTPLVTAWREGTSVAVGGKREAPTQGLAGSVLLAEDGIDNQVLITSILRRAGLQVVVAENGAVAVQRVLAAVDAGSPFDLILMDMQMPELDGYGAAACLRERGYRGPILALTAHAMAGERERCIAAGCDDYLSKPFDRREFLGMVERHLGRDAAFTGGDDDVVGVEAGPEGDLPSIADLDAAGGLERAGGDVRLYRDLLRRFATSYRDSAAQLRHCSRTGAWGDAARITHTLRGVSGNVGATRVFGLTTRLEEAIASRDVPALEHTSELLEHALAPLCAAIRSALTPAPGAEAGAEQLPLLRQLLEDCDPEATELFGQMRAYFEATEGPERTARLAQALDGYDFEQATRLLAQRE